MALHLTANDGPADACLSCVWFKMCKRPKHPCFWRLGTRINLAPVVIIFAAAVLGIIAAICVSH